MATSDIGSRLRFHEVTGDSMEPTIRRLDYVLVAPAHRYAGEGLYLIADPLDGTGAVFSCSGAYQGGEPMIRLRCHNSRYSDQFVSRSYFDEHVLAEVVMTCNVIRRDLLVRAAEPWKVRA